MLDSGTAINVNRAPRVFWKVFEKRIPSGGSRLALRLSHERLQSLLGCRIETVHRLVLHQLSSNRLNVGSHCNSFGKTGRIANSRDRQTKQDHDDADHDHDLEKRKARL